MYSFYLPAVSDKSMRGISVSKVLALGRICSLISSLIFFAICAKALTALAWIRMRKKPVIINATEENENVNE